MHRPFVLVLFLNQGHMRDRQMNCLYKIIFEAATYVHLNVHVAIV